MFWAHCYLCLMPYLFMRPTDAAKIVANVTFPENLVLLEDAEATVEYNVTIEATCPGTADQQLYYTGSPVVDRSRNIMLLGHSEDPLSDYTEVTINNQCITVHYGNFTVRGNFIGRAHVVITFSSPDNLKEEHVQEAEFAYPVAVLRKDEKLQTVFTVIVSLFSVWNNFMMGLQLDWKLIVGMLRKPVNPAIGFACQWITMPLLSLLYGYLLLSDDVQLWFGLFAVGCAPSGGGTNFWTIMLDGNVDLSVTMTFVHSVAALFMMPLLLLTIGKFVIIKDRSIQIPFENVVGTIFMLVIPSAIGLVVRHFRPTLAQKSRRYIKYSTLFVLLIILTFGNYVNYYIYLLFTWRVVLAACLLPYSGFVVAAVVTWALRRDWATSTAIVVETGLQAASISIVLILLSFGKPDGDLMLVMPVCSLIFSKLPLAAVLIAKYLREKCLARKAGAENANDTTARNAVTSTVDKPRVLSVCDELSKQSSGPQAGIALPSFLLVEKRQDPRTVPDSEC